MPNHAGNILNVAIASEKRMRNGRQDQIFNLGGFGILEYVLE